MVEFSENAGYQCPGERHPVSRAVHLARLAAFYPTCRECEHRGDTASLSAKQIEQLQDVETRAQRRPLFHDEGAGGVYLNDFTPAIARRIANVFGAMVSHGKVASGQWPVASAEKGVGSGQWAVDCDSQNPSAIHHSPSAISNPQSPIPNPFIFLAGDGRALTAELSAAVSEGIRSSGCNVIDIGPATSACLALAVYREKAAGGVLVGNPSRQPHVAGMQFWSSEARPLSMGGSLEPLADRYQSAVEHRAAEFGGLQRSQADAAYLETIREHYHALRPLRVIVDSASRPLVDYLEKLTDSLACRILPHRSDSRALPEQIRAESAHFAACVDGDGETCSILDECGTPVPHERILLLLARHLAPSAIVLEDNISPAILAQLARNGTQVVDGGVRRAAMATAMREHHAPLGGGPSGRFWHVIDGAPLPDALMTISRLLGILSLGDEPLSRVLDRDACLR